MRQYECMALSICASRDSCSPAPSWSICQAGYSHASNNSTPAENFPALSHMVTHRTHYYVDGQEFPGSCFVSLWATGRNIEILHVMAISRTVGVWQDVVSSLGLLNSAIKAFRTEVCGNAFMPRHTGLLCKTCPSVSFLELTEEH